MQAIARVRHILDIQKIGHAGTLDPMATGILPIALGEATKAVNFMQDAGKTYRFTSKWGEERNTDDAEGEVTNTSDKRPTRGNIESVLTQFIGKISQVPPQFSAIKIDGVRAYTMARNGEEADIAARDVTIERLEIVSHDDAAHETAFEMFCSKGTYVRSVARDMGRVLGCLGHVTVLRRVQVGLFNEGNAFTMDDIESKDLSEMLLTIETVLDGVMPVQLTQDQADKMRLGHSARLISKQDLPVLQSLEEGVQTIALCGKAPIAIVRIEKPSIVPVRVFVL